MEYAKDSSTPQSPTQRRGRGVRLARFKGVSGIYCDVSDFGCGQKENHPVLGFREFQDKDHDTLTHILSRFTYVIM